MLRESRESRSTGVHRGRCLTRNEHRANIVVETGYVIQIGFGEEMPVQEIVVRFRSGDSWLRRRCRMDGCLHRIGHVRFLRSEGNRSMCESRRVR